MAHVFIGRRIGQHTAEVAGSNIFAVRIQVMDPRFREDHDGVRWMNLNPEMESYAGAGTQGRGSDEKQAAHLPGEW